MQKRRRYRREAAVRVGRLLLRERKNRGIVTYFAERLEVTPQTLRNWRRQAVMPERPTIGRPCHSEARRQEVDRLVAIEMERQGNPGWRPIAAALPYLPVRLVQASVAAIKKCRRKTVREKLAANRTTTEVLAREAVWTIDGTQSKDEWDERLFSQAVKDRGSLSYRAVESGVPSTAGDVVGILSAQEGLPLVLGSDNDKIYCGTETSAWLAANKIVHLRSLPRTPQHNGAMEVAIRFLKEAAKLNGGTLQETAKQMNAYRLHGSKGYKTSTVLDAELPVAYHKVSRDVFYEKCMTRLSRVREAPMEWRVRRLVEREVIYATLEEYELIKRTGGEDSLYRSKAKIFL